MKVAASAKLQPKLRVPAGDPATASGFGRVVAMSSMVPMVQRWLPVIFPAFGVLPWTA
jgi:hypothetical protein